MQRHFDEVHSNPGRVPSLYMICSESEKLEANLQPIRLRYWPVTSLRCCPSIRLLVLGTLKAPQQQHTSMPEHDQCELQPHSLHPFEPTTSRIPASSESPHCFRLAQSPCSSIAAGLPWQRSRSYRLVVRHDIQNVCFLDNLGRCKADKACADLTFLRTPTAHHSSSLAPESKDEIIQQDNDGSNKVSKTG